MLFMTPAQASEQINSFARLSVRPQHPSSAEARFRRAELLRQDARLTQDGHEIGVPGPARHNVNVDVRLDPSARCFADVRTHVIGLRVINTPQDGHAACRQLHHLGAAMGLAFNTRLSAMMAQAIAPTGALMTFIALWTGALWGKPTWGTYWVWDARLTSELILLFLYFGFMALHASIDDVRRADRAAAVLAIVGAVNVPIIYYSVQWWNTLHQGASVSFTKAPSMAATMFLGMMLMAAAFWLYSIAAAMLRVRCLIRERE